MHVWYVHMCVCTFVLLCRIHLRGSKVRRFPIALSIRKSRGKPTPGALTPKIFLRKLLFLSPLLFSIICLSLSFFFSLPSSSVLQRIIDLQDLTDRPLPVQILREESDRLCSTANRWLPLGQVPPLVQSAVAVVMEAGRWERRSMNYPPKLRPF